MFATVSVKNLNTMKRTLVSTSSRKRIAPTPVPAKRTLFRRKSTNPYNKPWVVKIGRQNPIPPLLQNTVRYCEVVSRSYTTGTTSAYVFSTNGLYDPNISSTGHQPLYFDQLIALYSKYAVLKSRIKVTFVPSTSVVGPVLSGLFVDDDATVNNLLNTTIAERPGGKQLMFQVSSHPSIVLTTSWDSKAMANDILDNANLSGGGGSNPPEQSYFILESADLGSSSATMYMFVQIEYDVVWTELKDVTAS